MMKITVRFLVKIRSEDPDGLPDFGLGPGVLGTQELIYNDVPDPKSPLFLASLLGAEREVIDEFVHTAMQIAVEGGSEEDEQACLEFFQAEPEEES